MQSRVALITFLDGAGGAGVDNTLPSGGHPWLPGQAGGPGVDNTLPSGGHPWLPGQAGGPTPGHDLPGGGAHPWLPGQAGGPRPGHDLPGGGGGLRPVQLPVYPYDPTKPVDPAAPPPATTKPIGPDTRWKLLWSLCGWLLVPANEEGEAEPK